MTQRAPIHRRHSFGFFGCCALSFIIPLTAGCDFSSSALCGTPPYQQANSQPVPAPALVPESTPATASVTEVEPSAPPSVAAPHRLARIDPALITVTPSYVAAPPVEKLKPVKLDVEAVAPAPAGVRIELASLPAKTPVGRRLVAVARVLGPDDKPVPNADVEWIVERQGVGDIVRLGGHEEKKPLNEDRSSVFARCRSSATTYVLDPFSEGAEPITVQPGDAWCVLESHAPGDMHLKARSPGIKDPEQAQAGQRVHWFEAILAVDAKVEASYGRDARLSARVTNAAGNPLSGYVVRWEVASDSPGSFAPFGRAIESISDSEGFVDAIVRAPDAYPAQSQVHVKLFGRPVLPGSPTMLQEEMVAVQWSDHAVALEVTAPPTAVVGSPVTLSAIPESQGSVDNAEIVAFFGRDVQVLDHLPEQTGEAGIRFALAKPADTKDKGYELTMTSKSAGERAVRFELRQRDMLLATRDVTVRFVEPHLAIEKQFPHEWTVGKPGEYVIIVRNTGEAPATGVQIEDEIPEGLRIEKTDGIAFIDRIRWEVENLESGESKQWKVTATPERPFHRLALRAWAVGSLAKRAEAYDVLDVADIPREVEAPRGHETVELSIEDVIDPAPLGGKAVYMIVLHNRGSAPARDVQLTARLSRLSAESAEGSLPASVRNGELLFAPVAALEAGERLFCRVNAKPLEAGDGRIVVQVFHPSVGESGLTRQESTQIHSP